MFCKRYDAKRGKKPPAGAIPCEDAPDPVTGHWPFWVPVKENDPADKWFLEAYGNIPEFYGRGISEGILQKAEDNLTYESVGPHFQGNPYGLEKDVLIAHGFDIVALPDRSFEGIRAYLEKTPIEGIVFWKARHSTRSSGGISDLGGRCWRRRCKQIHSRCIYITVLMYSEKCFTTMRYVKINDNLKPGGLFHVLSYEQRQRNSGVYPAGVQS